MKTLKRSLIYFKQAKIMLQDVMVYRADFVSRFITFGARFLVSAYLWLAIIQAKGGEVAGYDVPKALTYFLLIQIVGGFAFSNAGFNAARDVQSGDLSNRLVQPIDYPLYLMALNLGRNSFFFVANTLIYVGLGLIFIEYFDFSFRLDFTGVAILSMVMGFMINFAIVCSIGLLAFWLTSSFRLIYVYYAVITLLSGTIVPLELFPQKMQYVLSWTPFPYMFYYPVKIMQSTSWEPSMSLGLGLQLAYSLLMIGMLYGVYHLGLKKYEAVGR